MAWGMQVLQNLVINKSEYNVAWGAKLEVQLFQITYHIIFVFSG